MDAATMLKPDLHEDCISSVDLSASLNSTKLDRGGDGPARPTSLQCPPRRSSRKVLDQELSFSGVVERLECDDHTQPIRAKLVMSVTVAIFISSLISFVLSIVGLLMSVVGHEYLVSGVVNTLLCITVAAVVRWSAHPLSHTALLQGYLLLGVLCSIACILQLLLVLLLLKLPPTPQFFSVWPWVQFFGGAQVAGVVVVVLVVVAGGGVMVVCGGGGFPVYRDSSVHARTGR
ncbi:hypothetical protein FHG87_016631 [Trinorchestia longiramus]|nr:hypothetical protein FHG87_016631 [Trinorchestia longiramus]